MSRRVVSDSGAFADHVKHAVFERLFVFAQTVLLPGVVKDAAVKIVTRHARIKEADGRAVVRFLLELEGATVLHEIFEFAGVPAAELIKRRLYLLLLNVIVLFILAAAW